MSTVSAKATTEAGLRAASAEALNLTLLPVPVGASACVLRVRACSQPGMHAWSQASSGGACGRAQPYQAAAQLPRRHGERVAAPGLLPQAARRLARHVRRRAGGGQGTHQGIPEQPAALNP